MTVIWVGLDLETQNCYLGLVAIWGALKIDPSKFRKGWSIGRNKTDPDSEQSGCRPILIHPRSRHVHRLISVTCLVEGMGVWSCRVGSPRWRDDD